MKSKLYIKVRRISKQFLSNDKSTMHCMMNPNWLMYLLYFVIQNQWLKGWLIVFVVRVIISIFILFSVMGTWYGRKYSISNWKVRSRRDWQETTLENFQSLMSDQFWLKMTDSPTEENIIVRFTWTISTFWIVKVTKLILRIFTY